MVVSCSFPFHGRLANWSLPGETPLMAAVRLATLDRADVGTAWRGSKQHHMELLHRVKLWAQNYFGIWNCSFGFCKMAPWNHFPWNRVEKQHCIANRCWLFCNFLTYALQSRLNLRTLYWCILNARLRKVLLPKVNQHPQDDNGNAIRKPSHHSNNNSCFFFQGDTILRSSPKGSLTMPWHADLPRFSGASKS